jgi:3-mercaptopyruvate sulfurtransferase SseA
MQKLGVGLDKPVVCYDNRMTISAARGAWLLEVFGHKDVSILCDKANMNLTEAGEAKRCTGTDFEYALQAHLLSTFEQVQSIVKGETKATIVDARPADVFAAGHIEGAINIPVG